MSNFPDFAAHGYQVVRELGRNLAGGRVTYLATATSQKPPLAPPLGNGGIGGVPAPPLGNGGIGEVPASPLGNGGIGGVPASPLGNGGIGEVPAPPLGKGGIGGVPVVIKQFQFASVGSDWSGYKAYEREIEVLQGLAHPGIPRYLDSFETPSGFCMVQEYKNAQSLAVRRSFDPDDIKQIAISILSILVYLQNRIPLVIHRDIKPENILVDEQLNVYLVDFGFARIGGGELAMSSVTLGTLGFMPPEQLYNRQLSEATDLYGLGATLICLLTGTKSTAIDTLIDEDGRIAFQPLVPKLSRRFIEWLETMVQPRQKDRFANATAALEALGPIYVTRLPEVRLSQSRLEFTATILGGEKLTQTITVNNPISDTVLEGRWEVAPHQSDPPHTPDGHAWISFEPAKFAGNWVDCLLKVDTSKLMVDKTYERQILLHANATPATYPITIQVQTHPQPINYVSLYSSLVGVCGTCLGVAWLMAVNWAGFSNIGIDQAAVGAWLIALVGAACFSPLAFGSEDELKTTSVTKTLIVASLCGLAASFGPSFLVGILALFGAGIAASGKAEALTEVTAVKTSRTLVKSEEPLDFLATGFLALGGALLGTGVGALVWALTDGTYGLVRVALAGLFATVAVRAASRAIASQMKAKGFTKLAAALILSLTIGFGVSLGLGCQLGFWHPLALAGVSGTGLPLAAIMIHQPLQRYRLIAKYRRSQQNLIKP